MSTNIAPPPHTSPQEDAHMRCIWQQWDAHRWRRAPQHGSRHAPLRESLRAAPGDASISAASVILRDSSAASLSSSFSSRRAWRRHTLSWWGEDAVGARG